MHAVWACLAPFEGSPFVGTSPARSSSVRQPRAQLCDIAPGLPCTIQGIVIHWCCVNSLFDGPSTMSGVGRQCLWHASRHSGDCHPWACAISLFDGSSTMSSWVASSLVCLTPFKGLSSIGVRQLALQRFINHEQMGGIVLFGCSSPNCGCCLPVPSTPFFLRLVALRLVVHSTLPVRFTPFFQRFAALCLVVHSALSATH